MHIDLSAKRICFAVFPSKQFHVDAFGSHSILVTLKVQPVHRDRINFSIHPVGYGTKERVRIILIAHLIFQVHACICVRLGGKDSRRCLASAFVGAVRDHFSILIEFTDAPILEGSFQVIVHSLEASAPFILL